MSDLRLFLVEDEPLILDDLKDTLTELGYHIAGTARSAEDCLTGLGDHAVDLLILDIQLDSSKDGIELAHLVNQEYMIPFIYLTAYHDDATLRRARATQPAGFIVKPWNEHTLKANIEMAMNKQNVRQQQSEVQAESFFVKQDNQLISVEPDAIHYAQSYDNYTYLYVDDNKYLISHTLKSVQQKLERAGFLRVHRSYLINLSKIDSIQDNIIHIGKVEIPVGRTYKNNLYDHLKIL